ncbi:MAG: AI-2E family transporter [Candidatus Promineifilaceae bacterium]|nr:AI-2E family transporter [Candidatus Promineifilaceae bacterium]
MDRPWANLTRLFVVLLAGAIAIWLMIVAAPLLQSIAIAALLAYLLNPVQRAVQARTPLGRVGASLVVFILMLLVLMSIPAIVGTVAVSMFNDLGADLLAAGREIRAWFAEPIEFLGFDLHPEDALASLEAMALDAVRTLPEGSLNILSSVTTNLLWGLVVFVMLFYFLRDGHLIKPWLVRLFPPIYQVEVAQLLDEVDRVWGRFLRIQILMFALLSVLMGIGTLLIVGLFRTGLLEWSPLGFILLLLALYTVVQQLDNLWLRPRVLGRQLHLHPALVFVALVGGLTIGGLLGALVAVPVIATVRVVGKYLHRKFVATASLPEEENVERLSVAEDEPESTVGPDGPFSRRGYQIPEQ